MSKILVVDDDRDFCESLTRYLSAIGYQAISANDGRDAMKALMREDPDLILLDLRMPVMDGIAFLDVIRSYLRFRSQPVIVTTGVEDDSVMDKLQSYGVSEILKKASFSFMDVRRAIEDALPN